MRQDEEGNACPETLGEYLDLVMAIAPDSEAVSFLRHKIKETPKGRDAVVIADDSQMRMLLFPMMAKKATKKTTKEND